MQLPFYKYQSLGNDLILLEQAPHNIASNKSLIQHLCHRHFGIGADGLLLIEKNAINNFYEVRMFNPDGTEAEKCINGLRCVAGYLVQQKRELEKSVRLRMFHEVISANILEETGAFIKIELAIPRPKYRGVKVVKFFGKRWMGHAIDAGNPHFVIFRRTDLKTLERLGEKLQQYYVFPDGVNVEFLWQDTPFALAEKERVTSVEAVKEEAEEEQSGLDRWLMGEKSAYHLRVFERGCGITLACGSGALGAIEALHHVNRLALNHPIEISMLGGKMTTFVSSDVIVQQAQAKFVFSGSCEV